MGKNKAKVQYGNYNRIMFIKVNGSRVKDVGQGHNGTEGG